MAKKDRPKPLDQGSAREIARLFIVPLLRLKPEGITNLKFLQDAIFHVNERTIKKFRAKKEFKMPGRYWATPTMHIVGYGDRIVKPRSHVFVREDSTMPDRIDVEIASGRGTTHKVFSLKMHEWFRIKRFLEQQRFSRGPRNEL